MQTSRPTSGNSLTRFPSDLLILSGLPILAVALLTGALFDLLPLNSEGDPTIISIGAMLFVLLIPITFIGHGIAALFSKTVRKRLEKHKWLEVLWGIAAFIIFCSLFISGHGNPNSRGMRRARTNLELSQIYTGILAYETEYGNVPAKANNEELVKILEGANDRKINFIILSAWELNSKNEVIDGWGTPIRVSFLDPKNPIVQSAGADRRWNTPDDITREKIP